MGLSILHCMTLIDKGVVVHVQVGEVFTCEVSDPITELGLTSRDVTALLTIQGVTYGIFGVSSSTVSEEI